MDVKPVSSFLCALILSGPAHSGQFAGSAPHEPQAEPHNPGADCSICHADDFDAMGTVFATANAETALAGVPLRFVLEDGTVALTGETNAAGNIAIPDLAPARYLVQVGRATSRTWHEFPQQRSCNPCHVPGGNLSEERDRQLSAYHTRIPADNDCRHCHHMPPTQSYERLATSEVLNAAARPPQVLMGSVVWIGSRRFAFDPAEYEMATRERVFSID